MSHLCPEFWWRPRCWHHSPLTGTAAASAPSRRGSGQPPSSGPPPHRPHPPPSRFQTAAPRDLQTSHKARFSFGEYWATLPATQNPAARHHRTQGPGGDGQGPFLQPARGAALAFAYRDRHFRVCGEHKQVCFTYRKAEAASRRCSPRPTGVSAAGGKNRARRPTPGRAASHPAPSDRPGRPHAPARARRAGPRTRRGGCRPPPRTCARSCCRWWGCRACRPPAAARRRGAAWPAPPPPRSAPWAAASAPPPPPRPSTATRRRRAPRWRQRRARP